MAAGLRVIKIAFTGDAKGLISAAKSGATQMSGWAGKIGSVGKVAAAGILAIGAAVIIAGKQLFDLGDKFQKSFRTIRVGTGATGTALSGLKKDFKDVAKSGPNSFEDVSKAIADLNTATGLSGKPLQDLAKNILGISRLTGEDLGTLIPKTTRLFGDWSISTDQQSATLDKLFRASQSTGVPISRLAELAVKVGAPFRTMGFTFDQTTALMGIFEKTGVNTELVIGGMRVAMGKWAKEGKDVPTMLKATIEQIRDAKSPSEAATIAIGAFGQKAGADLADTIRGGKFSVQELVDTIGGGKDTIKGVAKETETFGEKWDTFKNKIMVGLEPLATKTFNGVSRAMGAVTGAGSKAVGVFKDKLVPAFREHVQPTLNKAKDLFKSIGGTIKEKFAPVLSDMADTLKTKVLPGLKKVVKDGLEGAKGAFNDVKKAIDDNRPAIDTFIGAVAKVYGWMQKLGKIIATYLLPILGPMLKGSFRTIGFLIASSITAFGRFINFIKLVANNVKAKFNAIKGFVKSLGSAFSSWKAGVGRSLSAVGGFFSSLWGKIKNIGSRIKSFFGGIGSGIKNAFSSAFSGIKGIWNSSVGRLHFTIPGWVPGIGGKGFSVPQLQTGGPARAGQAYLVGERGPELLVMGGQSGNVIPNHKLGSGATYVTNIYPQKATLDAEELTRIERRRAASARVGRAY